MISLTYKAKHDSTILLAEGARQAAVNVAGVSQATANTATIAFAIGAVGLAGGAILWLTAPKRAEGEPKVSLGIGPDRVLLSGRF